MRDFEAAYDTITVQTIRDGFVRALGASFTDIVQPPPPPPPPPAIANHLNNLRAVLARELGRA